MAVPEPAKKLHFSGHGNSNLMEMAARLDPNSGLNTIPEEKSLQTLYFLKAADSDHKEEYNSLILSETFYLRMAIQLLNKDELLQVQFGGNTFEAAEKLADIIKAQAQFRQLNMKLDNMAVPVKMREVSKHAETNVMALGGAYGVNPNIAQMNRGRAQGQQAAPQVPAYPAFFNLS